MAKERLGLKNTLGLSPKIAIKKSEIDIEQTEKAVKEIHSAREDVKRVTIDMPLAMYKAMKIKIVGEQTARDYILGLIKADLSQ